METPQEIAERLLPQHAVLHEDIADDTNHAVKRLLLEMRRDTAPTAEEAWVIQLILTTMGTPASQLPSVVAENLDVWIESRHKAIARVAHAQIGSIVAAIKNETAPRPITTEGAIYALAGSLASALAETRDETGMARHINRAIHTIQEKGWDAHPLGISLLNALSR